MTDPQSAEAVRASDRAHGLGHRFTRREGTDWLTDHLAWLMRNGRIGTREAEAWFPEQARGTAPEPTPGGFLVPPGFADQLSSYFDEHMPAALEWLARPIDDDAPEIPPTRRQRLRNRITGWRERAARRAYKTIAGDWPDNREDDW